jgi:hypothetical protein
MAKRPPVVVGPVPAPILPAPITGTAGVAPPAGAPVELASGADTPTNTGFSNFNADTIEALSQPRADGRGAIDPSLIGLSAIEMARRNERELKPLVFRPEDQIRPAEASEAIGPPAAGDPREASAAAGGGRVVRPAQIRGVQPAPGVVAAGDRSAPAQNVRPATTAHVAQAPKPVVAAGGTAAAISAALKSGQIPRPPAADPATPAGSNSDSPSRGIPRVIDDVGKRITGGFGDADEAQYFPLDGGEALKVVWVCMDDVAQRIKNDLRFHPAITYPRIAVRCQVIVEGFPEDQSFMVERVKVANDRTPVELAEALADEVIFVVKAERREVDKFGQSVTPPNAMRQEIGAVVPRKHAVGSGNNRQIVDLET